MLAGCGVAGERVGGGQSADRGHWCRRGALCWRSEQCPNFLHFSLFFKFLMNRSLKERFQNLDSQFGAIDADTELTRLSISVLDAELPDLSGRER